MGKMLFAYMKTKVQINCTLTAADQHLCFRYTDSTIHILRDPKFQVSSHLLWLHSPVCVGPGQNPAKTGFLLRGSFIIKQQVDQKW